MTRKGQGKIFGEGEQENHFLQPPPVNDVNGKSKTKLFTLVKNIFALQKFIVSLVLALVFLWTTVGQLVLPVEYRFATFMGERMGDMNAQATRTALSATVEQANALANEQSNIQIHSSCIGQRNSSAMSIYNDCLQKTDAILAVCEFRREQILNQSCDSYTPAPILSNP